jgi:hypothetical protein
MLLDALPDAIANERPILIVKVSATVDLLAKWGVAAICNGAKWKPEHLRDANVVVLPDDVGWKHLHIIGASLNGVARRIRVLMLPSCIADWIQSGGTREQLFQEIDKALDWTAPAKKLDDLEKDLNKEKKASAVKSSAKSDAKSEAAKSEDELLDALAKMRKGIQFDRERKRLAKALHVRPSAIDDEIQARQVEAETDALLHGHWFVEPSKGPVEGDSLIRDIIRKLRKHVVISFEGALAIALWIVLAWMHDEVATHSPILVVTSAVPESGKTTTLKIIAFLVPRAIATVDVTEAALYRSIEKWHPTLVIDEFDTVLFDESKSHLRSVINSGHTKGTGVLRINKDNNYDPEEFSTFGPKAIGMVGRKMPPQTLSRCIFVDSPPQEGRVDRKVQARG